MEILFSGGLETHFLRTLSPKLPAVVAFLWWPVVIEYGTFFPPRDSGVLKRTLARQNRRFHPEVLNVSRGI